MNNSQLLNLVPKLVPRSTSLATQTLQRTFLKHIHISMRVFLLALERGVYIIIDRITG